MPRVRGDLSAGCDVNGYVAITDPEWFQFLRSRSHLDEVNFWMPRASNRFRALAPGEPLFFKLKAPYREIGGFGIFQRYDALPAWLAWEAFREGNGAASSLEMYERIGMINKNPAMVHGTPVIGCIILGAPMFFDDSEWIDPPRDWPRSGIQRGKTYELEDGEGRRLYDACVAQAKHHPDRWAVESLGAQVADGFGPPVLVRPRRGQGVFSLSVRDAYDGACAITNEHSAPVLEAAHIVPYAVDGRHDVTNGLLLRTDVHRLFDRGYVTVTPDYTFRVSDRLRDEYHNGKTYYDLDGRQIRLPADEANQPDRDRLAWHLETVFV